MARKLPIDLLLERTEKQALEQKIPSVTDEAKQIVISIIDAILEYLNRNEFSDQEISKLRSKEGAKGSGEVEISRHPVINYTTRLKFIPDPFNSYIQVDVETNYKVTNPAIVSYLNSTVLREYRKDKTFHGDLTLDISDGTLTLTIFFLHSQRRSVLFQWLSKLLGR